MAGANRIDRPEFAQRLADPPAVAGDSAGVYFISVEDFEGPPRRDRQDDSSSEPSAAAVPAPITYRGTCHCERVRFTFVSEPIESVVRCNCSICRRKGARMTPRYYTQDEFELLAGADALAVYRFGDGVVDHWFCKHCGIAVYHNDAAKSAEAHLRPGVFTLGEIGYVDDDGFVFITDRFSDMVVSGGVNLYPAEAEQVLVRHPDVGDIACIGIPHAEMGEQLIALVIPTDPLSPPDTSELITYCRDRLSHYKCPRSIEIVADLGRNAMGKINKKKLRAPYWE